MADLKWLFDFDVKTDELLELDELLAGVPGKLGKVGQAMDATAGKTAAADDELGRLRKRLAFLRRPGEITRLKDEIAGLEAPPGMVGRAVGRLRESVGGFARETLAHFTALATFNGMQALVNRTINLGEQLVNVAAGAERTASSFRLLLGAEEGAELLQYLDAIAKHTEFDDDRLKGMAQSLLKVGFAAKEIPRAMGAALDLAAISGNPEAGLGSALATLERIKQTGRFDMRSLRGVGIKGETLWEQLSKDTGVGIKTLKKQMNDGKLDVEQVLESLYTVVAGKTGKDLGAAGVMQSKGLQARMAKLRDLPDQFMQGLAGTPALAKFNESIGKMLEAFDPDSPRGKRIAEGLEKMVTVFADMIGKVNVDKMTDGLVRLFEVLPPGVSAAAKAIELLVRAADLLITLISKPLPSWLAGKAADLSAPMTEKEQLQLESSNKWHQKFRGFFGNKITDVMLGPGFGHKDRPLTWNVGGGGPAQLPWNMVEAGTSAGQGLASGMLGMSPLVSAAAGTLAGAAAAGVEKRLQIRSPSRVFQGYGAMTGEGFAVGLESSTHRVDSAIDRIVGSGSAGTIDLPTGRAAAGAAGMGPVTINVPITVNAAGGGDSAREIAQLVGDLVPGQLQAALEQLRLEMGIA